MVKGTQQAKQQIPDTDLVRKSARVINEKLTIVSLPDLKEHRIDNCIVGKGAAKDAVGEGDWLEEERIIKDMLVSR